ncbi:MAG: hypothetical protein AAF828_08010 [Bacteroidota bacterium]
MYQALSILSGLFLLVAFSACQRNEAPPPVIDAALVFINPGSLATEILTQDSLEGYFEHLSQRDLQLQFRQLTDADTISLAAYREWLPQQLLSWEASIREKVAPIWTEVLHEAETRFPKLVPDTVQLLLTEDAPYGSHIYFTRNRAVIMPISDLILADAASLKNIFRHELFHLISRSHPEWREDMYRLANFVPAPTKIKWPTALSARRLTNPDAPNDDYMVAYEGAFYLPILYAPEDIQGEAGGALFSENIRFQYHRLQADSILEDRLPIWTATEITEANSAYIIHPEEILAEHFAFLLGGAATTYPDELADLEAFLRARGE